MRGYQYIWLQLSASIINPESKLRQRSTGARGASGHAEKVKAIISLAAEDAEGVRCTGHTRTVFESLAYGMQLSRLPKFRLSRDQRGPSWTFETPEVYTRRAVTLAQTTSDARSHTSLRLQALRHEHDKAFVLLSPPFPVMDALTAAEKRREIRVIKG